VPPKPREHEHISWVQNNLEALERMEQRVGSEVGVKDVVHRVVSGVKPVPAGVQEHHFLFIIEMGEFK
jgi:hypothetical protein